MAASVRSVKLRFKSYLPGSGFNVSGSPVQGKTRVVGVVDVSSYGHQGVSLTPNDIGLNTIDYISLRHENEAGGKEGSQPRRVHFNNTTNDFYILLTTTSAALKPIAAAATAVVQFVAEGDSAAAPELT